MSRVASSSVCTMYKENAYKVLYRWYLVPSGLRMIYSSTSDRCRRGCRDCGDFLHIWWSCPIIEMYFREVLSLIDAILGIQLPFHPLVVILGAVDEQEMYPLKSYPSFLITQILLAAKLSPAAHWKNRMAPSRPYLLTRICDLCVMDKITCTLNNTVTKFINTWYPFIQCIEQDNPSLQRPEDADSFSIS